MTGRTHFVVGETAALLLSSPGDWKELTLCVGAAAIGSSICDIDVSTSKSHRYLTRVLLLTAAVAALMIVAEWYGHLGILALLQQQVVLWHALVGCGVFLAICAIGMHCPHRTLMHSLPGWFLLCGILRWAMPPLAAGFAISMMTHILLDLLNYKGIHLLYPVPGRYSLDLCPADGKADRMFFRVGTILLPVALLLRGILWM